METKNDVASDYLFITILVKQHPVSCSPLSNTQTSLVLGSTASWKSLSEG